MEMASDRETFIIRAEYAGRAERYDDMVNAMKQVVKGGQELTIEERNLLFVAYNNTLEARRSAWRIISDIESKSASDKKRLNILSSLREDIEKELKEICADVLRLLEKYLLKDIPDNVGKGSANPELAESILFYLKMRGDYYRYLAEVTTGDNRDDLVTKSEEAYKTAYEIASKYLPPTHPIRLDVALNYSAFVYEIRNRMSEACSLAKDAFDQAMANLDGLNEEAYKNSTLIMQLLKDNLTKWR